MDVTPEQLTELLKRATCPACKARGQMTVAEKFINAGGLLSGSGLSAVRAHVVTCGACGASGRVAGVQTIEESQAPPS
jgi:hypothetical protein